ncbi:adenylate/guanylate cyclase domain-containing protein [Limibacillus sp. MBR-115]|jgi:adenylate cyclase|uniref:adenylate/guanylate cyclase domain-containing protein n=1 Tax=Limibacillus sp. MBR-115 TaxID=3156465 RepID=UPI00339291F4
MGRRLAAIFAGDVVGFSRLMGLDETGTLARLKQVRKTVVQPKIDQHHGRVVKLMGDGLLVEFGSVVDAVTCAIEIQQTLTTQEQSQPDERQIRLRIGVNLGDIILEGSDIYGDGVNIAARLETLSNPGGVCISGAVYEQVQRQLPFGFEDGGEQALKNIDRPIRIWRWLPDAASIAAALPLSAGLAKRPDKPSIAVLPFDNMSGDPEQEFFADGMTEDIITALSRMPWFFVIARNSSFTYKGRSMDVKQVSAELGVKYLLEGSVRKAGERLRITAQLIDATTGNHVWAERFDRMLADIFDVQDEVTASIVGAIAPEFLLVEAQQAKRKDASQLDAWECVMRGRAHLWKLGRRDANEARLLFERAISHVPSGEFGMSDLALVHFLESYYRWSDDPATSLQAMASTAKDAVAIDDTDPWALTILSWSNVVTHQWDEVLPPVERAIDLSPNFASAIGIRGAALALLGEAEKGIDSISQAIRLSPRDGMVVFWLMGLFWAYMSLERHGEAASTVRQAIRLAPRNPTFRRQLASALAWQDRMEEARQAVEDYRTLEPTHTTADAAMVPSKIPADIERFVEGLRRAGLPDSLS